jgi:flagellar biosynthetic protein FliQ
MTPETVMTLGQRALELTALVSAPLLISALVVGLIIGMFQAATTIQELSLSFIPKVVVMGVALAVSGPWILQTLVAFTRRLFLSVPSLIAG